MCKATEQVLRKLIDLPEKKPDPKKEPQAYQAYQQKHAEFVRLGKRFLFITFDHIHPETLLTQPVWTVAGHEKLQPMLKLPAVNETDQTSFENR
jgi:hypothetical protein